MRVRKLAHVSDLHVGLSRRQDENTSRLALALSDESVDCVVLSGDVTHRGKRSELELFRTLFAPLFHSAEVLVVPGNHDRLGDDLGMDFMPERPIKVDWLDDLYVIRVDSTGFHNRSLITGHGELSLELLNQIDEALDRAPAKALRVLTLHHHPLPLPQDNFVEWLLTAFGWPHGAHLDLGADLVQRLAGRCDLLLHGHRHFAHSLHLFPEQPRPLAVYNAGSSSQLGRALVFTHFEGSQVEAPRWICRMPVGLSA